MYCFVDQPVQRLAGGSHFVLWAMRGWTLSATQHRCPTVTLAGSFARLNALEVLNDFHEFMRDFHLFGRYDIVLHKLDHPQIGEGEALLLALWSDVVAKRLERVKAVLALVTDKTSSGEIVMHMDRVAKHLSAIGLPPAGFVQDMSLPHPSGRPA